MSEITELEAMGYTVEQAEKVDGIARSIAQASGVPVDKATQAICSVMRALSLPGDAEIAMIQDSPSLNIFQKWRLIHKIKKWRKKERRKAVGLGRSDAQVRSPEDVRQAQAEEL